MGDNSGSKSGIPAWQRAAQKPRTEEQHHLTPTEDKDVVDLERVIAPVPTEADVPTDADIEIPAGSSAAKAAQELVNDTSKDSNMQLANMRAFLAHSTVQGATNEKKRAFFEQKGISKELIDQVLNEQDAPTFNTNDFESFKRTQALPARPTPQPAQQARPSAPPIITYPEFLMEARKPPPLITPTRVLNTAYIAGGFAALLYGASQYLIAPMSAGLTESRHDFAGHSLGKVDEMNERLSKLVSKVPEVKKEKATATESEIDDTASEVSDPAELYHRNIGTQTSPPSSRTASLSSRPAQPEKDKQDMIGRQTTSLRIMKEHLSDMLERTEKLETPYKDANEKISNLRHQLDTMLYASPGVGTWSLSGELESTASGANGNAAGKADAIEDLKKEIRAVKGVLLSAKRFPGVTGSRAVAA